MTMRRNVIMAKLYVKTSKEVVLRKSILSMFVMGMFVSAYADTAVEKQAELDSASAIDLSGVVVTAAGFSQAVKDAPASISVISGAELSEKPISGLGPALKDVEGVNVTRGGKAGGYNISIRGMPSDYTLILVDGKRLSQSSGARPNGFGDVDTNFIPPMSAVQQIEVVRGPMSTLYGSDAMGGVINIITKKVPEKWGGEISFGFTEPQKTSKFGRKINTSMYVAGPLVPDTLGLAVTAGFSDAMNAKGKYAKNQAEVNSGEWTGKYNDFKGLGKHKNHNYGAKLSFTPNGENDIILSYDRGVQRFDNSEEQLGTLNSSIKPGKSGGGYKDELKFTRDRVALSHQGRYDSVTVDSSILWDKTETLGRTYPIGAPIASYDETDRNIEYTNIVLDNKWMFALGDHFISAGMQYRHQDFTDGYGELEIAKKQWQWAMFVEDEWSINDQFIATFGLRFDKNEDFGNHFSPRVYLTWNIDDSWQLKGGVSQAFKAPDVNMMHDGLRGYGRQGTLPLFGNANLKEETSTSAELGVYFDNNVNFSANATAFYTKFKDKIDSETVQCDRVNGQATGLCAGVPGINTTWSGFNEINRSLNLDDAKLYGVEMGMRYQPTEQVGIKLNYTYTDSSLRDSKNNKVPFSTTPKHMVNAKVDWQINDAWNIWADAEYRAKEYEGLNKVTNKKEFYKPYALVNLGAKYQLNESLSFTAGVDNVFNKNFVDYQDKRISGRGNDFDNRYARIEEGRRFWLNAKYTF